MRFSFRSVSAFSIPPISSQLTAHSFVINSTSLLLCATTSFNETTHTPYTCSTTGARMHHHEVHVPLPYRLMRLRDLSTAWCRKSAQNLCLFRFPRPRVFRSRGQRFPVRRTVCWMRRDRCRCLFSSLPTTLLRGRDAPDAAKTTTRSSLEQV